MELTLALSRSELNDLEDSLDNRERQLAGREAESDSLRTRIIEIPQRLDEIDKPVLSIEPDAYPTLAEARHGVQQRSTRLLLRKDERTRRNSTVNGYDTPFFMRLRIDAAQDPRPSGEKDE